MVSIKDVAKEAGVGLGTVSRVINKSGPVKDSTRVKVEKAIKALNYKPNEVARSFKMQQTHSVALIIPTLWHPFFSKFAYHTEKELAANGYKLIVCNSQNEAEKEINYISMLEKNKIDGLITITYTHDLDQYISSHLPIVSIDRHFTQDVVYVTSDNETGGKVAVKELVKRGSCELAYLGSVSAIKNESVKRVAGFKKEAELHRCNYHTLVVEEPVKDIYKTVLRFLEDHPKVDGIFAMNDKWAKIIIRTLKELGKNVPQDVQVIGYDGITSSKDEELTFSTIKQPVPDMAAQAVQALIKIIKGKETEQKIVLPVTFFEGNSTRSEKQG
ncbi:LacI family transcriptional regulator [Salipaludibacillus aurantiacus]|uniref:LacI family transcriptional regulator n=2 Tax=Salipaludibacillus aurantiacus TaxID=1601833 RepID=A0A1H9W3T1_9BACI|nr:LacI family transcriptional regulator [Salipaludibacillus aurantiacus]